MNTLIFISGAGLGALVSTCLMILAMKAWSYRLSKQSEEAIAANKTNTEALLERNEIGRDQVTALNRIARLLCRHRNVTVADVSCCDDCGAVVEYDRETRNWK